MKTEIFILLIPVLFILGLVALLSIDSYKNKNGNLASKVEVKKTNYSKVSKNYYEEIDKIRDSIKQKETAEAYALLANYIQKLKTSEQRTWYKDWYYSLSESDYDNIISLYNKALELDENNLTANLSKCDYLIRYYRYVEGFDAIKKALRIDPNNIALHNNLGLCYIYKNEYKEAILEFLYVAHSTRDDIAYVNLACAFFGNKEYDNAIRFSKLALEKNPQNTNAIDILEKSICYKENPPVPIEERISKILKGEYSHFVGIFALHTLILIIAMFDLSHSTGEWYYPLLRLITCGVCVYSLVKFKTEWAKWIFGGLAVLYNPIFPIHLGDKEAWTVINLLTIIFMWITFFIENKIIENETPSK